MTPGPGPLFRFLRSPRLALSVLSLLAAWCGAAAWYPWMKAGAGPAPRWAIATTLDHPFTSPLFLAAVVLLFASTLVCTSDRTVRLVRLSRGQVRPLGTPLPARPGRDVAAFLCESGFGRARGGLAFRNRWALWGGWLLHVGLLALIGGVLVQQGWHDGGAFALAVGESLELSAPGAVFSRDHGPFAPASPPSATVALAAFDPFLHQRGYAPDRASRLRIARAGHAAIDATMDRADGIRAGELTLFQAIPSGLALVVAIEGTGTRVLHLREETPHRQSGRYTSPAGRSVSLALESERPQPDPAGTGALRAFASSGGPSVEVVPGTPFDFGGVPARIVSVAPWGGFTWSVDPGMPAVFAGFGLLLLGALLMSFPAGVALVGEDGADAAAWVYLSRGRDALLSDWSTFASPGPGRDGEA